MSETPQQRETNSQRRERVLRWPDLADYLTHPPLRMSDPKLWSGYIPPAEWRGKANDSPVRAQLIAICNMVAKREREEQERSHAANPVAPEMINEAQLQKLHICLNEYGITERDDKLMYLGIEVNRKLASSKDLTKDEASLIIDTLGKLIRAEQAKEAAEQHANQTASPADPGRVDGGPDGDYRAVDQPRPGAYGNESDGPKYDPGYFPGEEDLPPY